LHPPEFNLSAALLELAKFRRQPGAAPPALGSNPPEHLVQFHQNLLMLRQGVQFGRDPFLGHLSVARLPSPEVGPGGAEKNIISSTAHQIGGGKQI
jgi:hypothetical protein